MLVSVCYQEPTRNICIAFIRRWLFRYLQFLFESLRLTAGLGRLDWLTVNSVICDTQTFVIVIVNIIVILFTIQW